MRALTCAQHRRIGSCGGFAKKKALDDHLLSRVSTLQEMPGVYLFIIRRKIQAAAAAGKVGVVRTWLSAGGRLLGRLDATRSSAAV